MQGNCDTPIHLKTTNSPDESKINLFRKRLEGIKGTYVKIVKKNCFKHDDSIMENYFKTKSDLSQKKKRLLKDKA